MIDFCVFANVKLIHKIARNNKDETDTKPVNILTNALSTLSLGKTLKQVIVSKRENDYMLAKTLSTS